MAEPLKEVIGLTESSKFTVPEHSITNPLPVTQTPTAPQPTHITTSPPKSTSTSPGSSESSRFSERTGGMGQNGDEEAQERVHHFSNVERSIIDALVDQTRPKASPSGAIDPLNILKNAAETRMEIPEATTPSSSPLKRASASPPPDAEPLPPSVSSKLEDKAGVRPGASIYRRRSAQPPVKRSKSLGKIEPVENIPSPTPMSSLPPVSSGLTPTLSRVVLGSPTAASPFHSPTPTSVPMPVLSLNGPLDGNGQRVVVDTDQEMHPVINKRKLTRMQSEPVLFPVVADFGKTSPKLITKGKQQSGGRGKGKGSGKGAAFTGSRGAVRQMSCDSYDPFGMYGLAEQVLAQTDPTPHQLIRPASTSELIDSGSTLEAASILKSLGFDRSPFRKFRDQKQ